MSGNMISHNVSQKYFSLAFPMTEKRTIFAFVQRRKRRAKWTFLPFKFQTIGNQLVQYAASVQINNLRIITLYPI